MIFVVYLFIEPSSTCCLGMLTLTIIVEQKYCHIESQRNEKDDSKDLLRHFAKYDLKIF